MFIAAALIGSVVAFGDNMAFATKKHNDAEQEIEQGQENEQNAQCVSGDFSLICGNNVGLAITSSIRQFGIRPTINLFFETLLILDTTIND